MAARNARRYRFIFHRTIPMVGVVARFHERMLVVDLRFDHKPVRVRVRRYLLRGSELHARQEVVA